MDRKNKLAKETPDQENKEELCPNDHKAQEKASTASGEKWWNSVCYPDPRVSER